MRRASAWFSIFPEARTSRHKDNRLERAHSSNCLLFCSARRWIHDNDVGIGLAARATNNDSSGALVGQPSASKQFSGLPLLPTSAGRGFFNGAVSSPAGGVDLSSPSDPVGLLRDASSAYWQATPSELQDAPSATSNRTLDTRTVPSPMDLLDSPTCGDCLVRKDPAFP